MDKRHGGPFDRGGADYYYGRVIRPHYFKGSTYQSDEVTYADMTEEEVDAYFAGYKEAERNGDRKDWG